MQRVLAESLICRSEKPDRGVEPERSRARRWRPGRTGRRGTYGRGGWTPRGVNRRRCPTPCRWHPNRRGTVDRPKCLRDGTRRQHEVPDAPRYQARIGQGATGIALVLSKYSFLDACRSRTSHSITCGPVAGGILLAFRERPHALYATSPHGTGFLDVKLLSTGAIFMAITAKDFYRSSNGDRWQLIRDTASGRSFVRHEPNLSSGGRTTDTDVEEFLNRTGSSPENLALRALLDEQTRMDPELVREAKPRGPDKARRQRPA